MDQAPLEKTTTVVEALEQRALETPDALAFGVDGERLGYAELCGRAAALAGQLRERGLGHGDRCLLQLPTGAAALTALFATQWLGAVPAFVDSKLPATLRDARLARLGARHLLVAGADQASEAPGVVSLDVAALPTEPAAAVPRVEVGLDDLAYLQFTSGTEGESKAVMITHRSLSATLWHAREYLAVAPDDVFVSWLPLHHDFGLVRFVFAPLFFGVPCHLLPPSLLSLERWLRTVSDVGGTVTGGPDFAYRIATRMVSPDGLDLSSLRLATNGGEPVRAETIRDFHARFGVTDVVHAGYGLAEATLTVSLHRLGPTPEVDGEGHVSNGAVVPGLEVRVVDGEGVPLGPGEAGALEMRGESVFSGYFDLADPGRRRPPEEWVPTGDLGYVDAGGQLYVLGRLRSMIKTAGRTLTPTDVAAALDTHPEVRFSAAVGLPNPDLDHMEDLVVVAEVRPRPEASRADWERLARELAQRVKAAVGTRAWQVLLVAPRTLPKTHNGKLQHRRLQQALLADELRREGRVVYALVNR